MIRKRALTVVLLLLVCLHLVLSIRMQDPEEALREWEEEDEDINEVDLLLEDYDDDEDYEDDEDDLLLHPEGFYDLLLDDDEEDEDEDDDGDEDVTMLIEGDEEWDPTGQELLEEEEGLHDSGPFLISADMQLNGKPVPRVGFGTAGLGDKTFDAVSHALARGFRVIDTAAATMWYDEVAVGKAIASVADDIPREEIFLITKIWPTVTYFMSECLAARILHAPLHVFGLLVDEDFGRKKTLDATERSLQRLNTTYVDLLLLHFPDCNNCEPDPERGTWLDAWRALEEVYRQGKAKAIGVSNFDAAQLDSLLADAEIKPHDVQNWMDPYHQDRRVREMCEEQGIHYTSYSTLGTQWQVKDKKGRNAVLSNPIIKALASRYEVSPVLIVLSWALQENVGIIPRSSNPAHIDELAELFETPTTLRVYLTETELDQVDELDAWGPELFDHYAQGTSPEGDGEGPEEGFGRDEL